ncbi:MAG: membrane protein insertion efficiency factor YidD [Bacteroidia bacterium]|jgi:hypothetical protein|nr:membrane protein insertion efficiency factor YidD [Bacteroidia bacterium]
MKYLLIAIIKLYWKLTPPHKRRCCCFKVSCSNYVFQQAQKHGFIAGWKALTYRFRTCRNGSRLVWLEKEKVLLMVLANGDQLNENEISENLVRKYKILF